MIHISHISKSYGKVIALKDISLNIDKNELFGLIGPDGAGKTTLFRILTTLLVPDKGLAEVAGYDTVKSYKKIRTLIGYMPGKFSLYQDLSVEENLSFFASVFGTSINENYDLIKDIYRHIEPFRKRRAGNLSGGMKQKLALSCALIHKPEVLILDEPTTGVDAVSRKEFWEMLGNLRSKGITIVVSTPYMDEAMRCDRIALIQKGEILGIDTPKNIIGAFGHKMLAVRSNDMYKLMNDLRNYVNTRSVHLFGQYLHYTQKDNSPDMKEFENFLKEKGHLGIQIDFCEPTIEDCFIELMVNEREH
ncbi:MAG: ABC transporter ATP-binding protein [Bacteroidota bacterium]